MMYRCDKCEKTWTHPLKACIFCGEELKNEVSEQFSVIGFTEVFIPSIKNETVPYYVFLLEDEHGNKCLKKSYQKFKIGDKFDYGSSNKDNTVFGVIGTGLLGMQICEYLITSGYVTVLKTRDPLAISTIQSKITARLQKSHTLESAKEILKLLVVTTSFSEIKSCDLIIEAVPEKFELKTEVFRELSKICDKKTIFSTNSSSLSISKLATFSDRPDKFIGIHFFNPVKRMDLVEVVVGEKTSEETTNRIVSLLTNLKKKPIIVKDSPGYIVNRLLLPQINEAIIMLEEGIASKEDIDTAVKLGLNHPMGPFQLADYIGLDICLSILEVLDKESTMIKNKPAALLYKMCEEGKLGIKTKEGFYKY